MHLEAVANLYGSQCQANNVLFFFYSLVGKNNKALIDWPSFFPPGQPLTAYYSRILIVSYL